MKKLNKMDELKTFQKNLNLNFKDLNLLKIALTHRSYLNEKASVKVSNERLEYLGDAVLELLVSDHLYTTYSDRAEGELTSLRSATVKTETLASTARKLDYGKFILMSKGEESTGGRDKDYILANTFESVLGAIYIDKGLPKCKAFLKRVLFPLIQNIVDNRLDIDPKTQFQEISQDIYKLTPTYELKSETGPDHEKIFLMTVYIGDKEFGTGTGPSKQKAEEDAAKKALKKIKLLKQ
ncbi:MAG: ribonuclease III [Patescibacteria group bacterium]|nr:ribonuclease III [Patescibacteria group bacterium]